MECSTKEPHLKGLGDALDHQEVRNCLFLGEQFQEAILLKQSNLGEFN